MMFSMQKSVFRPRCRSCCRFCWRGDEEEGRGAANTALDGVKEDEGLMRHDYPFQQDETPLVDERGAL